MTDTLAPQAGKRYRLRNGKITGVLQRNSDDHPRVAFETVERISDFFPMWNVNGRAEFFVHNDDSNRPYDIVEEYTE